MSRTPLLRSGFVAFALVCLLLPTLARADWDPDVRAGYYTDAEAGFVGGGLLTGVGHSGWYFNPNVEIAFPDNGNLYTLNGDFHYDFGLSSDSSLWLGLGPALVIRDRDRGDNTTDAGLNLIGGLGLTRGAVRPYVQGKVLISDDTEAVVAVGLRFH